MIKFIAKLLSPFYRIHNLAKSDSKKNEALFYVEDVQELMRVVQSSINEQVEQSTIRQLQVATREITQLLDKRSDEHAQEVKKWCEDTIDEVEERIAKRLGQGFKKGDKANDQN